MDENKCWVWFWAISGITVCCIGTQLLVSQSERNKHEFRMAEQGYEQVVEMMPGQSHPVYRWEKTNDDLAN